MPSARLKAAQQGSTHYDGRPCRNCGNTKRYTSTGNCVDCTRKTNDAQRRKVQELLAQARAAQ